MSSTAENAAAAGALAAQAAARHRLGIWLVLGAAFAWSSAGFFTRVVETDLWTMLVWRGGLGGLVLFAVLWARDGRKCLAWWPGSVAFWVAVVLAGVAMVAFIAALSTTSVAKVSLIYAAVPFAAAMLAFAMIGERPSRNALVASAVAAFGIVIMVAPSLHAGASGVAGAWYGDVLALVMTLLMALLTVHMRRHPELPMVAVAALSCLLSAIIALPFADSLAVRSQDIFWLALFGPITSGIGFVLYAQGAQRLPAAEAALLGAMETPLGPLWVWLLFSETPDMATLLGGGLIFVTLLVYIWRDRGVKAAS